MKQAAAQKGLSNISVLVVGTTCCDMINPEFDFLDEIAGDGLVVDSRRMVPVKPGWLELKKHSYAMGGGSLNIAPLVSKAGTPAGILTSLGKTNQEYDLHGQFMLDIMKKTGTHPVIIPHRRLASSASFIKPAQPGKREAILHAPNAVDDLDIERGEVFRLMTKLPEGAIVHFVYSGLARTMDSERGKKLARVMERLKGLDYITMVDPHTLSKDPKESISKREVIEGYKLLEPVLPHLSWFFSSEAEAMMIANTFGYRLRGNAQKHKNEGFLLRLIEDYSRASFPRIFGITAGTDITIIYHNPPGKSIGPLTVKSRYVIADADKFVGAGDSFRAGFEVEWTKGRDYSQKFREGEIKEADLERLCLIGHLMAACYVTRTPADQYGNIPHHRKMAEVVDSGQDFKEKTALLQVLK